MKTLIALLGAGVVLGILWIRFRARKRQLQNPTPNRKKITPSVNQDKSKQVPWRGEIIAVHVMAIDTPMTGARIMAMAKSMDLDYGPYDIFHRYAHPEKSGDILFSVASAVEPGTFELETLSQFETAGLTVFMRLEGLKDPMYAFEAMLTAAEAMREYFNAELQDPSHHPLTDAMLQAYRTQILDA